VIHSGVNLFILLNPSTVEINFELVLLWS